jgi:hypothetical protein
MDQVWVRLGCCNGHSSIPSEGLSYFVMDCGISITQELSQAPLSGATSVDCGLNLREKLEDIPTFCFIMLTLDIILKIYVELR